MKTYTVKFKNIGTIALSSTFRTKRGAIGLMKRVWNGQVSMTYEDYTKLGHEKLYMPHEKNKIMMWDKDKNPYPHDVWAEIKKYGTKHISVYDLMGNRMELIEE